MANVFKDEFVPNEEASTGHKKWVTANKGEAAKWAAFRDAAIAHKKGDPAVAPPAMATAHGKALIAAGKEHMSVTDIGSDQGTPPPPPPPTGTIRFLGDFETGNLSQWDLKTDWQGPNGSFTVVPSGTSGVPSRNGSYMGRVDVRTGDGKFGPGTNVDMVGTTQWTPLDRTHYDLVGDEWYYGFSIYLPSSTYNPYAGAFNYMAELHGDTSGQAPVKLNLNGATNRWSTELHVLDVAPAGAWNPTYLRDIGPVTFNAWTDFTWHVKWATGSTGIVEMWMNGNLVSSFTGPTWGAMSYVKRALGCYRQDSLPPFVLFVDQYKVGDTYSIVQP